MTFVKFRWEKKKGSGRILKPLWHVWFCQWLRQPSLRVWVFAALMWLVDLKSPLKAEKGPWCILDRYTFVTVRSNFVVSDVV